MIRCVTRVSRTSFRRTRPYRLRSSTPSQSLSRVLSSGPLPATDDAWAHPSSQTWEPARKTATKGKQNETPIADGYKLRDTDEVFNFAKKSLGQKKLDPRVSEFAVCKKFVSAEAGRVSVWNSTTVVLSYEHLPLHEEAWSFYLLCT